MSDDDYDKEAVLLEEEDKKWWHEWNKRNKNKNSKNLSTFGRIQQITPNININLDFNDRKRRRVVMWVCVVMGAYWMLYMVWGAVWFFLYASMAGWLTNKVIPPTNTTMS